MKEKNSRFYFLSVAILLAASAYPIYMGIVTLAAYLTDGSVNAANYPKYIIPYTPLSIALLLAAILMPVLYRRYKRYALIAASILGAAVFFLCEFGLEQIRVVEGYQSLPLSSWQYSLCVSTPQVLKSIGEPIYAQNNPAYKVHFYIIALVILLSVTNILYGFTRMISEKKYEKKRPLITQLICAVIFVGLCIYACFTAFYRTGTIEISPLSSALMSVFFIMFGVTFGVYFGCMFYGKRAVLSSVTPSFVASATAFVMYLGELVLMNGQLFRYGTGAVFEPIDAIPLAPADITVIILAGVITLVITRLLNSKKQIASES